MESNLRSADVNTTGKTHPCKCVMSSAHPTKPRDGAEMCKTINPVQLLIKRNQVRQKKPSIGMIYSVPSSHPRCSHPCCFHLPLCWGHIHVALEEPPRSLQTQQAGTSQHTYWEQHSQERHSFIQQEAEGGTKQRSL